MTKVKEMAKDVFSLAIKEQITELRNKALKAGVPNEDIEIIIANIYTDAQNFQLPMVVRKVSAAITNRIRAVSAKVWKGLLVGSKDRTGKNIPARYTLLRSDGKHIELSNFGTSTDYQGQKFKIPIPSYVEVRAEEDPTYGGWNLVSIEKFKVLTKEELAKNLSKVIIPISAITADFTYKKGDDDHPTRQAKVVVIGGQISKITTEPVWRERDDGVGDTIREIDHHLPVYMPREAKKEESLPCFGFMLYSKTRGINSVRCHLRQMRHGTPTTMISDLEDACADTVAKIKDPEAQAESLSGWFKDIPVIVVGSVDSFKPSSSSEKGDQNWVDISVSCVVDTEGMGQQQITPPDKQEKKPTATPAITTGTPPDKTTPIQASPAAAKKKPPAAAKKPKEPEKELEQETGDQESGFDIAGAADQVLPNPKVSPQVQPAAPPAAVVPAKILELAKLVKIWCRAAGIKPTDVTVATLKEQALDIVENVEDAVVESAIKEATVQMQQEPQKGR